MKSWSLVKLTSAIIICLVAGAVGSAFTADAIPVWYAALNKPSWTPPNWTFAPIWTTLYILMGISLYLIFEKRAKIRGAAVKRYNKAVNIFWIQLGLNALWSILFFGLRSPLLGLLGIAALWIAILFTIISFRKISKKAAYLLLPYIVWVTIAAMLNLAVVLMNL
jgi:tryptophan-rich sensory protein